MKALNHPRQRQIRIQAIDYLESIRYVPPSLPPKGLKVFYLITTCEVTVFTR
jgi:hypothetical protein